MNVGLAVDRDFLEDYARQCFQVPNPLPLFDHGTARMDTSAVRMLQRRILNVLRTFGDSPELVEDPVICVSLIEHLLYPIIDNFIDHGECDRWAPPSTRDYIVSRGREIIEAGLGQPIRMADMCRELRISQRTLEYSFQDVLGVSPASYINMRRLNAVRRDIIAHGDARYVKSCALRWGFTHLGRFAQSYRTAFGEMPSDTRYRSAASSRGGIAA